MSGIVTPPAGEPPAVPPVVAAPPVAAPTAADPPKPAPVSMTSDQLTQRLSDSRNSGMSAAWKALGYESEETAKAAVAKLKKIESDALTETERLQNRIKELEPLQTYADLSKSLIDEQFAKLPAAAQTVIDEQAKGDPAKRYMLMKVGAAMQGAPPPPAPPGPPPVPPPASLGTPPAPPPTGAQTKFNEWQQMQARSPVLGDLFYQNNRSEIERTRPSP